MKNEKMKFYVISYETGTTLYGEFPSYFDAVDYALQQSRCGFTIEEYDSENDYFDLINYMRKS